MYVSVNNLILDFVERLKIKTTNVKGNCPYEIWTGINSTGTESQISYSGLIATELQWGWLATFLEYLMINERRNA
jgi:hypothetical protein